MKHFSRSSYLFVATSLFMALVMAACGGGGPAATAIPTSTQIPTYNYVLPTSTVGAATAAPTDTADATSEAASTSEATATSEAVATSEATAAAITGLDQEVVIRGKGRYDALDCASCHGENGVGTDKGSSLLTSTLNEGDFIAFMRSGGKLGAAHQFATNRLSISGGEALYQYMLSLRTAS